MTSKKNLMANHIERYKSSEVEEAILIVVDSEGRPSCSYTGNDVSKLIGMLEVAKYELIGGGVSDRGVGK